MDPYFEPVVPSRATGGAADLSLSVLFTYIQNGIVSHIVRGKLISEN